MGLHKPVDQAPGDAQSRRDLREIASCKPTRLGNLGAVGGDLAAAILRCEPEHQGIARTGTSYHNMTFSLSVIETAALSAR